MILNNPVQSPTPSAPQNPPQGNTINVTESPILTTPGDKNALPKKPGSGINFSRKIAYTAAGLGVFVLLVVGIGSSYFLTQQNQDVRQQASTPAGTARIQVKADTTSVPGGTSKIVPVTLSGNSTPQTISVIQFSAIISGAVPTDFQFVSEDIPGMQDPQITLTSNQDGGKTLEVRYDGETGAGATLNASDITLGNFSFTAPQSGNMTFQFLAENSQVRTANNNTDILRPPATTTLNFVAAAVTATQTASPTPTGTSLATATPTATITGTITPTMTGTSVAGTTTPTKTPTRTPTRTPTKTPTLTSVASSSASTRESSLPVETQEKPVSGSVSYTFFLFISGIIAIGIGVKQLIYTDTAVVDTEQSEK